MNFLEWVAIGSLIIAVVGLALEVVRLHRDSRNQLDAMKVMMDYISIQKDAIASLERESSRNRQTAQSNLELQREQQTWIKVMAAAKAIGWLYDREMI